MCSRHLRGEVTTGEASHRLRKTQEGGDDPASDGDANAGADQEGEQGTDPGDDAGEAAGVGKTLAMNLTQSLLFRLDSGELGAESVEVRLAGAAALDADRIRAGGRISHTTHRRLTDLGLPGPGRFLGLIEPALAHGIVADQRPKPLGGFLESGLADAVGFEAVLAAGQQVPAQTGLLVQHGDPEGIERADDEVRAAACLNGRLKLPQRGQHCPAPQHRHQRDDADGATKRAVEANGLLHARGGSAMILEWLSGVDITDRGVRAGSSETAPLRQPMGSPR